MPVYQQLIAKAILFKVIDRIVRRERFLAYQANIKTYLMAYVAFRSGSQLALDIIWNGQAVSDEFQSRYFFAHNEINRTASPTSSSTPCRPPTTYRALVVQPEGHG